MKTRPADDTGPDGRAVQQMFAEIAPRYDFLNHFLSASVDRLWRKAAVAKIAEGVSGRVDPVCLDLCSGTGDLAMELHRRLAVQVVASDFCHPMLVRCLAKLSSSGMDRSVRTIEADSLALPFPERAFDAVAIAFGLRNLQNPSVGLGEMNRVLKAGGTLVVLEF